MIFINILLCIIGYLMIGGFINGIIKDITCDVDLAAIIFWPIVIIAGIVMIGYKIGARIKDLFD